MEIVKYVAAVPSALIRYGVLFPLRFVALGASTAAFFITLPIAVTLKNSNLVVSIKYVDKIDPILTLMHSHSLLNIIVRGSYSPLVLRLTILDKSLN